MSYQLAPRAKISRRDQGGVLGMAQLKAYMRSNSWASEPYSGSSPFGAICSRGDLDPSHPKASGCNDAKVRPRKRMPLFHAYTCRLRVIWLCTCDNLLFC